MLETEDIHQAHDKFFKTEFTDPVNAAAFLRWEIEPTVSAKISWDKLHLEPGTFIDSKFRHTESDLLFSAPLADQLGTTEEQCCYLYFLFEHQTTADQHQALRLLSYKVRIWEKFLNDRSSKKLPVIEAVVLAQNERPWNIETQFSALFDIPTALADNLRPHIPDFRYQLIQLASIPYAAIRGTPSGILTLRIMKAERAGELLGEAVWDETLFEQTTLSEQARLLTYIFHEEVDKAAILRKVKTIQSPKFQAQAMSVAQQLRQEGRQESLHNTLVKILKRRFSDVPEGLVEAIQAILDTAKLNDLIDAALDATTIEEFACSL
jgi:predicted transposase/invertase (TIGR01784 family)